ncbi:C6 zinc finger domain-containing protein [Nannizzia gypsea CBS 118893]|uniref:C6 finger domain transcription factor nscR n=1 Tax=Arthroderma gypseum (strain ATCC MYA-4604 / CBS 118893) TaxID=535722 RepID=NSCR_ARTGP|nr:C6 zinc finger domain-containing protein [Nannizzia gypsea CBS 118893]E4V2N6.1 RecName: Full=C6 finger domain transcription factor nscR; AltName: Full=Neosartiricin B biosynthesis protein R [Nannizzia gypsea CBS 118893]EFR03598.1 C6 zinc finger domain-containing protein [Nannizzia gypsea CBS 118893]
MEKRGQKRRQPTAHLSCELCRERKVKCDKLDPCTNCASAGVVCIPVRRPRLPRGAHVQRMRRISPEDPEASIQVDVPSSAGAGAGIAVVDDLKERIRRLESLVDSMRSPTSQISNLDQQSRDIIELTPNELDDDSSSTHNQATIHLGDGSLRVLGLSGPSGLDVGWTSIIKDKDISIQLCQVYLLNVDPVIKILHRPSVERWMLQGERYLGFSERHSAVDALGAAICYAAATSLTETQSWARFHATKSSIVSRARRACEAALEKSNLLVSPEVTTLQAFVLYLVARRSEDPSRAVWTLMAFAVRIAKALDLPGGADETFFSQQMRKRLWLTICLLDFQTSLSRPSEPLISVAEATSSFAPPKHINDSDFGPKSSHDISDREGLTDTTFSMVSYHVQAAGRLLNFESSSTDKEILQQHVQQFEQKTLRLLFYCDPESTPYAWFTWHRIQCFVTGARLSAIRPLRHQHRGSTGHLMPSLDTNGSASTLSLALNILEKVQLVHTDPRGEGFRWFVTVPWQPLAVAISECYVCQDKTLIQRALPIVEAAFQQHKAAVSGTSKAISTTLERLMCHVREKLSPTLCTSISLTASPAFEIANIPSTLSVPHTPPSRSSITSNGDLLSNWPWPAPDLPHNGPDIASATEAAPISTSLQKLDPLLLSLDSQLVIAGQEPLMENDQSWAAWEEVIAGLHDGETTRPNMFLS